MKKSDDRSVTTARGTPATSSNVKKSNDRSVTTAVLRQLLALDPRYRPRNPQSQENPHWGSKQLSRCYHSLNCPPNEWTHSNRWPGRMMVGILSLLHAFYELLLGVTHRRSVRELRPNRFHLKKLNAAQRTNDASGNEATVPFVVPPPSKASERSH